MRNFILLATLALISAITSAQKQNNNWYFGFNAGLDFNTSIPTAITGNLVSNTGSASISDPNGNLLFYTNGRTVWDRNHNVMPNGMGLLGGITSAQPALIVPFPNSTRQYYLFTTGDSFNDEGLNYSIVDMSLNAGFGDVIQGTKNTLIDNEVGSKVTAILHPNGTDIWIITHRLNSNEFLTYFLNSTGLDTIPIVSSIGSVLTSISSNNAGQIKGSNNGSKLVFSAYQFIEMFDFDLLTGIISNFYDIDDFLNAQESIKGFEFSPNDSLIYISTFEEGLFVNHLYQMQIQTLQIITLNNPIEANPGGLQLGPDNKVYCNRSGESVLSIIHQPNKIGMSCQFEYDGILLAPTTIASSGFPAKAPYSFFLDSSIMLSLGNDTTLCFGSSLLLSAELPTNCDSLKFEWNNGSTNPEITVDLPGIYWVHVESTCFDFRDTIEISFFQCLPIVHYNLDACESVMSNGSHMDYTEFVPSYPSILNCASVSANYLSRIQSQENKHSCTQGINDSPAMCVTTLNSCEYQAGNIASIVIEFTIDPAIDSLAHFTVLEFYEKGPATYSWINGPSGLNNYPKYYGVRILKNGIEIFRRIDIPTNSNWTLQNFDFIIDSLFRVETTSVFRIEFLPYCPVGNGATVSAWDIDEIKIFGGCSLVQSITPKLIGHVLTKDGRAIPKTEIQLSENPIFSIFDKNITNTNGYYLFNNVHIGRAYFLQGFKNDDVLNGVSTLDLLHIQKHLLGISSFSSLHQYIAADINHSGHISALDLLDLRKVILGIYSEFPNNTSWRLGPSSQEMNGNDISKFNEVCYTEIIGKDTQIVDFVGIKVGDINGDAKLQGQHSAIKLNNRNSTDLVIDFHKPNTGTSSSIFFKLTQDLNIAGLQFEIDLKNLDFIALQSSKLQISPENYSIKDGIFKITWSTDDIVHISNSDTLFNIVLNQPTTHSIDAIKLINQNLKPEIYSENLDIIDLNLIINGTQFGQLKENIFYISPNPVKSEVSVHFNSVNEGMVEIRFFDFYGKLLLSITKNYLKGEHVENINLENFPSGMIFCQLLKEEYSFMEIFFKIN